MYAWLANGSMFMALFSTKLFMDNYGMTSQEAAATNGRLNFYSSLCVTIFTIIAGYLVDLIGRKFLICSAIGLEGILIALMPVATSIYPGILLLRLVLAAFSLSFITHSPFNSDYIAKKSLGAAMAVFGLVLIPAAIMNQVVLNGIFKKTGCSVDLLFYIQGTVLVLVSISLFFLLKEMPRKTRRPSKDVNEEGWRLILRGAWEDLKSDKRIWFAMLGNA
jgi:MFS family permease